jgi:hypothetical protein
MHPQLSQGTCGWLRFIWDKATTPDDWSSGGEPHPWWDRSSTAPLCAIPRFDLAETAYILPLLADKTPAWREVYARIADELVGRHTMFWAAIDWLTLIGHDPHPDAYPPEWLAWMPPHLQGHYDPPGWTANGVEPWGLQPDPIGSDGNLFFRGFFNLLLSVYRYVAGDEKWEAPFRVAGYRERTFEWTHHRIAEFIYLQWKDRPQGPHCENTKIWPFCVSGAGLSLQLYDRTTGSAFHGVYDEWVEFAKKHYMKVDRRGRIVSFPLYYDPLREVVCAFPNEATGLGALAITPYVLPQHREFGELLYRESVRMLGWGNPAKVLHPITPDPRFLAIGLFVARELGDATTEKRIRDYVEGHYEPRWFGDEETRFGWWFGTGEPYPRGQLSALMMLSEAGEPGAWTRVFRDEGQRRRFAEPTLEGVDYPNLGVNRAWNDSNDGVLHVATFAATPSRRNTPTSFRVTKLANAAGVAVYRDGALYPRWRAVGADTIEIETEVGEQQFRVETRRRRADSKTDSAAAFTAAAGDAAGNPEAATGSMNESERAYQPAAPTGCSCC